MGTARWLEPADLPGESWAEISGYRDYEISSLGRVRSNITSQQKILRGGITSNGYPCVTLVANGIKKTRTIHRLVFEAFVGPVPDGMHVRHLDGDKQNRALSNLAVGTPSENAADKLRHGTLIQGEASCHAKLTARDVEEIRKSSLSNHDLSIKYDVHVVTIRKARRGDTWKGVPHASPVASC